MELINGNICLRSFKLSDAENLAKIANDKRIADNVRDAFPHPYTVEDAKAYLGKQQGNNPVTTFAIEFNGKHVGNIGLSIGSDVYRLSAEVGYFIGVDYWGRGIGSKALGLIVDYAFNELKLVRIFAGVFDYNPASMRVLEKCGFKKEGIALKAAFKNGQICDEHRFAIINLKYF